MLYRETIAVCSEIHTKHTNTVCGQNVELLDVTPGGTYSNNWTLKGLIDSLNICCRGLDKLIFMQLVRKCWTFVQGSHFIRNYHLTSHSCYSVRGSLGSSVNLVTMPRAGRPRV